MSAVRLDARAAAALTCAVAGLFMFNVVLGPLAIGLGVPAVLRGPARVSRGVALAAVVLGAVDLVVLAVLVVSHVDTGIFSWHL